MKNFQERSRKWISYLSFVAMLVSSAMLVYLALSQLPRQRYILQSIFQEEAYRVLSERHKALEKQIQLEESKILSSLQSDKHRSFFLEEKSYAESAFLLDAQFKIVVPQTDYSSWKEKELEFSADTLAGRFFLEGQKYEFTHSDYIQAAKFYSLAMEQSLSEDLESACHLALVSCFRKSQKYELAIEHALQAISKAKKNNPYQEMIALYWYAHILETRNDPKGLSRMLDLYQRVIKRDFFLPRRAQYLYWEKILSEFFTNNKRLNQEQGNLYKKLEEQRRVKSLSEDLSEFLQTQGIKKIRESLLSDKNTVYHTWRQTTRQYWIAFHALRKEGKFSGIAGFSINLNRCREIFSEFLNPTENFKFVLHGKEKNSLWGLPENGCLASLPLSSWEGCQISVYAQSIMALEKRIHQEKIFTLATTALITFILFVGFYFTWRNFRREVELSELKSNFVTCISHELRTPLALIQSYSETLSLGRVKEEKKFQYYQVLVHEAEHLGRLIKNILNLSKIEAGQFSLVLEEVSLRSLLENIVSEKTIYWPDYQGQIHLEISKELPSTLCLDATAMRSAIFNLLDNAIKYSPKEQDITIGCKQDREIYLWIQDHGKGIEQEEQKKIFQKFYRGHSAQGTRGIGIGLKMVNYIVKAHKGRIELTSQPGEGTLVKIYLPIQNAENL